MNKLFARISRTFAAMMIVSMLSLNAAPLLVHAQEVPQTDPVVETVASSTPVVDTTKHVEATTTQEAAPTDATTTDTTEVAKQPDSSLKSSFSIQSLAPLALDTTAPPVPTIVSPANGSTVASIDKIDWTDVTDEASNPVAYTYQYSMDASTSPDGSFVNTAGTSGPLTDSEIPTPSTPNGTYYFHVSATDGAGNTSAWTPVSSVTVDSSYVAPAPAPTPSTVVVKPGSLNNWYLYDDHSDLVQSDTSDHGFVTGPSTPAAGAGSVHLTKTTNDSFGIATNQFVGTALSSITALSYSTYRSSGTAAQAASLGFDVDSDTTDGDTGYQGRLTYEPYFTQTVNTGAWQTWNTTDDNAGTGNWWFSHATLSGGAASVCTQSNPCTWSELKAAYPHAAISGRFILRTNGATGEAFDGNVDNLHLATATADTTYDFEPTPPAVIPACSSGDYTFDTFNLGSVNGQHGWSSTGSYDQAIVNNTYGYTGFGCKSLRLSNAVTSGAFGDQTFSNSNPDESGETDAVSNGMSGGTRYNRFVTHFSIASTMLDTQPGLAISVSPDRGDGARMSYLRFVDSPEGINVFFDDVQGMVPNGTDGCTASTCANFVETQIAGGTATMPALSRTTTHVIKFTMDFVNGPSNDVVRVIIDQTLAHTGTSWEDYYRFDPEQASGGNKVPTVDSLLFRAAGTAAPATIGKGYLFDNINFFSIPTPTATVTIDKFLDGTMATAVSASSTSFAMLSSWNAGNLGAPSNGSYNLDTVHPYSTNAYEAITSPMNIGSDYSTNEVVDGTTVGSSCTLGAGGPAYKLDGYTQGATLADAEAATPSLTAPSFTNLQSNQYVIVWNSTCSHDTEAPTVPVQLQPVDGQATQTNEFDFDWTDSTDNGPGPITYEFQSSMDGTEVGGVLQNNIWSSGTLPTSMIHSSGAPDGTWYWQVRAKDAAGNYSAWSPIHHMTIDSHAPGVPTIVTPTNDTHGTSAAITQVAWTDESDSGTPVYYTYEAATDPAFTNIVYTSGTLTDPMIPTSNTPDGVYYVRVKSFDFAGNESAWSSTVKITVDDGAPTASFVFPTPGPSATSFQVVYSESMNQAEATDPANYSLTNWPGAGGSGPLTGEATVTYDDATHTATVTFTNPAWYVSAEQEWSVTGVHDLAGNDIATDPTNAYSSPLVAPEAPGAPTTTTPTLSTTQDWTWTAATDPGDAMASGVASYEYMVTNDDTDAIITDWTNVGNTTAVTTTLPLGSYTLHVRAIDKAGNVGAESNGSVVVTDGTVPTSPATPTPLVVNTNTGGRGFSGSGPATSTSAPSGTSGGQVLGASTFNFTQNLTVGSRISPDVTELQKILIADGYLKIDAPTGYFGKLTRAAVAAWQAAKGISPAVGYFGPISRAKMNAG
ncbi:hypothetical protein BH11PAT2_BH11PAT2_04540 [soil metagenome]